MKFDFKMEQKVLHDEHNDTLVTIKRLEITREELLQYYAKGDSVFFNTLRETIYMFHVVNGFITQLTDNTMQNMYDEVTGNPECKGICYFMEERERLSHDDEYDRTKSATINLIYLQ